MRQQQLNGVDADSATSTQLDLGRSGTALLWLARTDAHALLADKALARRTRACGGTLLAAHRVDIDSATAHKERGQQKQKHHLERQSFFPGGNREGRSRDNHE